MSVKKERQSYRQGVIKDYEKLLQSLPNILREDDLFDTLHKLMLLCKDVRNMPSFEELKMTFPVQYKDFYYKTKNALHEELKLLKSKIRFAEINNSKCTKDRKRMDEICDQLGYTKESEKTKRKDDKYSYGAYKITPSTNIKMYRGGGCSGK